MLNPMHDLMGAQPDIFQNIPETLEPIMHGILGAAFSAARNAWAARARLNWLGFAGSPLEDQIAQISASLSAWLMH